MNLLTELLSENQKKKSDLEKVIWLTQLFRWIQKPRALEEKEIKKETIYTTRLRFIQRTLENNPELALLLADNIKHVGERLFTPYQLAQSGLPVSNSFQQDLFNRVQEKILPQKPLSDDLASMLIESFPDDSESLLIDSVDPKSLEKLIQSIPFGAEFIFHLKLNTLIACHILSVELLYQANLLTNQINHRKRDFSELVEFQLENQLRLLCEKFKHKKISENELEVQMNELSSEMNSCDQQTDDLFEKMQMSGVKIELVYGFQNYRRRLRRLRTLFGFFNDGSLKYNYFRLFLSQTVIDVHHQNSLLAFLVENLALMTKRIVQSNTQVGEHYVTYTWPEFIRMFYSSAGGGFITAFTVFLKQIIGLFGFTGFIKGFIESLNYSGSFLLIQSLGFTLATKQPSSTALYLAQALEKSISESRKTIVALLRTQFIAVLGNVVAVTPICFVTGWIFYHFGYPLYSPDQALSVIQSSQLLGLSPIYAAITGVLLFISSLMAGWFENFCISNQIDLRMRENPKLRKWFGQAATVRFSDVFMNNANAIAGTFSLGFILGLAPQFIKFLGVPIEVRHVTLASGTMATALYQALDLGLSTYDLINSVSGILVIGFLNISISFSLAFLLASVSTQVSLKSLFRILFWGLQLVLTKPWLLLVPEKEAAQSGPAIDKK